MWNVNTQNNKLYIYFYWNPDMNHFTELFGVPLYQNNTCVLLLQIISSVNSDRLLHERSVRRVCELTLWTLGSIHISVPPTLSDPVLRTSISISIGFVGSVNSGNNYLSPNYHIYCSLLVPGIPSFLSQNSIFWSQSWLCNSSTLSITSSEYQYLHLHWTSAPYFLPKIVHRLQKCHSKLHVMRKLNRLELSTVT